MRRVKMRLLKGLIFTFVALLVSPAWAADALLEAAKKEGKVVWYTTLTTEEADLMGKKFHEKYPFIEIDVWRSGSEKMLLKIEAEAQAKRHNVDVIMITGAENEILKRKGLLARYLSPHRRFFPEGFKDKDGYWTDLYINLNVVGYNTRLVQPREIPKTYEDLLAPRWKGKIGMDTKAYEWFASMLKFMGEKKGMEYMKKLGEQNIVFRTGRTLNAEMVAAGEVEIGVALYNQRIEEMKAKGASIDWVGLKPIFAELHPLSVYAYAPHPNAAKLLVDYLLSMEGQKLIASFYRIPSREDVDAIIPHMKRGIEYLVPSLDIVDRYDYYTKLYRQLLMRK